MSSWCSTRGRRFLSVNDAACRFYGRRVRLPEDSAFLEKPFHQLSLLRAVRALIDQPRSRSEAR